MKFKNIEKFLVHISEGDFDKKRALFIKELFIFLDNREQDQRMEIIFKRFDEIYLKYRASCDLWYAQNSIDRLKLKIESEIVGILNQVNVAMDNLKTEILIIASSSIAIGQINFNGTLYSIKNLSIIVAILVSCIIFQMIISISNRTVNRVFDKVKEREKELLIQTRDIEHSFITDTITQMREDINFRRIHLIIFNILLWMPLIISIILILVHQYRPEALEWIIPLENKKISIN